MITGVGIAAKELIEEGITQGKMEKLQLQFEGVG